MVGYKAGSGLGSPHFICVGKNSGWAIVFEDLTLRKLRENLGFVTVASSFPVVPQAPHRSGGHSRGSCFPFEANRTGSHNGFAEQGEEELGGAIVYGLGRELLLACRSRWC